MGSRRAGAPTTQRFRPQWVLVACVGLALGGCAAAGKYDKFETPAALTEARATYARVVATPAATAHQSVMLDAKKDLDAAEAALGTTWEYVVIDNAYVAGRKAELVEVQADISVSVAKRDSVQQRLAELEAATTQAKPAMAVPPGTP